MTFVPTYNDLFAENLIVQQKIVVPEVKNPPISLTFVLTHYVGESPETGGTESEHPFQLQFRFNNEKNYVTVDILEFNPYEIITDIMGSIDSTRSYFFECYFEGGEEEYENYFRTDSLLNPNSYVIDTDDTTLVSTTNISGDVYLQKQPRPPGINGSIYFNFEGSELTSDSIVNEQSIELGTKYMQLDELKTRKVRSEEVICNVMGPATIPANFIRCKSHLTPETGDLDIGSSLAEWRVLHCKGIYNSGTTRSAAVGTSGTPVTDGYFTNLTLSGVQIPTPVFLDSGWINLTFNHGTQSTSVSCRFYRIFKMVLFQTEEDTVFANAPGSATRILCSTIPTDYRPTKRSTRLLRTRVGGDSPFWGVGYCNVLNGDIAIYVGIETTSNFGDVAGNGFGRCEFSYMLE